MPKSKVQLAYQYNNVDWKAVHDAVAKEGRDQAYAPDTLSYINQRLIEASVPEDQRAAILGNIFIETGGRPSLASSTGPKPTYYGLLQMSKERLPNRASGMKGLDYQIDQIIKTIGSASAPSWGDGGTGTNFNSGKQAYDVFWGKKDSLREHLIPKSYNILQTDLNKINQAFVDGYQRPLNRKNDNVLRATAAKAIRNKKIVKRVKQ